VDGLVPVLGVVVERLAGPSEDGLVGRVDVGDPAARDLEQPEDLAGVLGQLAEALLAGAQVLALGRRDQDAAGGLLEGRFALLGDVGAGQLPSLLCKLPPGERP